MELYSLKKQIVLGIVLVLTLIVLAYSNREFKLPSGDILFQTFDSNNSGWRVFDIDLNNIKQINIGNMNWVFPINSSALGTVVFLEESPLSLRHEEWPSFPLSTGNLGIVNLPSRNPSFCQIELNMVPPQFLGETILVTTSENIIETIELADCEVEREYFSLDEYTRLLEIADERAVFISNAHILIPNWLVVSLQSCFYCTIDYLSSVIIINLHDNTLEHIIENATNATWSPDGTQLAYIGIDGLYIIETETYSIEYFHPIDRITVSTQGSTRWHPWLPFPQWAADGTQLIYHRPIDEEYDFPNRDYNIYLFDLELNDEILLIEDGVNPTWMTNSQ